MSSDDSDLRRYVNQELPKVVRLLEESRVRELDIEDGAVRLRVRRGQTPLEPARGNGDGAESVSMEPANGSRHGLKTITAPMVGVYYHAEQPGRAPLVVEGGRVERGALIGVIEALQVLTEVESDVTGMVEQIFAQDGQSVEYGQPLIEVAVED